MDPRPLVAAEVSGRETGTGGAADWLVGLEHALAGAGPGLLPVPGRRLAPATVRSRLVDAMRPDEPLEHPGVALVVPTSGSTGEPKGALLTTAAIRASVTATRNRLGGPGRWVLAMPLTHVAGLMVLARSLDAGNDPYVLDLSEGFDPTAFGTLSRHARADGAGPLFTSLVPAQLALLLAHGVDLDGYDAILLGGGAAPPALLEAAAAAGARVVTTYGMSETCGGCVYDGVALDAVTVATDAAGRVRIGGPTLFVGYRRRPDLTAAALVDGEFMTADLGRVDGGRLTVLGRADDVIVTGGANVPAGQVADVLAEHPGVRACAVVGVDDPTWGQRVVAVVEAVPGPAPTLAALRAFAEGRLEPAAVPRGLVVVPALPLLPSGKIDRETIKAMAGRAGGTRVNPEES